MTVSRPADAQTPDPQAAWLAAEKRCGRLDPHRPHRWSGRQWEGERLTSPCSSPVPTLYRCTGFVVIEGGEGCTECQRPVAECGCYARLVEARRKEWYS